MFTMLLAFFVIVGRLETENDTISNYPQIISIAQVHPPAGLHRREVLAAHCCLCLRRGSLHADR